MRSVAMKFVAFILSAVLLVCAVGSGLAVAFLGYEGLYDRDLETIVGESMEQQGESIAQHCLQLYANYALGKCPEVVLRGGYEEMYASSQGKWNIEICQGEEVLASLKGQPDNALTFEYTLSVTYLSVEPSMDGEENAVCVTVEEESEQVEYLLYQCVSPEYTVRLDLSTDYAAGENDALLAQLYGIRYQLLILTVVSLLLFAACLVYLCCVAGRSPRSREVRPGGLNRLPLDLYAGILIGIGFPLVVLGTLLFHDVTKFGVWENLRFSILMAAGAIAVSLSLLVMALVFALAAQVKTKGGYWWRNSLIGRIVLLIGKGIYWLCKAIYRLFCLLPVIWRLALIGGGAGFLLFIVLIITWQTKDLFWELGAFLIPLNYMVLLGYLCYAYGTLFHGVQKMKRGDLSHKIDTRFLFGSFKEFAKGLNEVSQAAGLAAEKQLRSERMKTELITNVSHDIKTPLTSIINYVDLLQKPHSEQEEMQYLEVLSRQSQRLKKLVDDLMEMSKASTGNIATQITQLDAVEAVTQALGEFADKLDKAKLTPILDAPETPVMMLADSRLVWRVLSNLLSNTVKYALPGTRVYLSVRQKNNSVVISVKNISKEQLGISAEELMERFVRGDASRNTEGSGLGLNIAKSLMELQKGQLKLSVDGDLFKVTLIFPEA